MNDIFIVDHTFSFEDVLNFLSLDSEMVLSDYGKPGKKSLEELYEELTEREIKMFFDPRLRRIVCYRFSTKTLLQTQTHEFNETMRLYRANTPHLKRRNWTVSETRLRTETPIVAARRGVREELGYDYPESMFRLVNSIEEVEDSESRVYPRMISRVAMSRFIVDIKEQIYPQGKIVIDHGVWIYLEWFERK